MSYESERAYFEQDCLETMIAMRQPMPAHPFDTPEITQALIEANAACKMQEYHTKINQLIEVLEDCVGVLYNQDINLDLADLATKIIAEVRG